MRDFEVIGESLHRQSERWEADDKHIDKEYVFGVD
jgi:hypothetical protein